MDRLYRRIVGCLLVLAVAVTFYMGFVQIVNTFKPDNLIKSFVFKNSNSYSPINSFAVGDTMTIVAGSDIAQHYTLQIYQGSSIAFESSGQFEESTAETDLFLNPPSFNVGLYLVVLNVYMNNIPVLGATFSDSQISAFEIVGVSTELGVNARYRADFRSLYISASLTDKDGRPVVGETIDFRNRFSERRRLTDGWIPLGSTRTDSNGLAELRLAFNVRGGDYSISACHKGNVNFGSSGNITSVEVASSGIIDSDASSWSRSMALISEEEGNWTIVPSSYAPSALLQMNTTAAYSVGYPLEGIVAIVFFLDYMNSTGFLGAVSVEPSMNGSDYVYEGTLVWSPDVTGIHTIIAGIANGTITELIEATHGIGIDSSTETNLDIQSCPSNLVLQPVEAIYNNTLPVTVGFSKPRPYEPESGGFYVATTIAPELTYNEVEYAIDEAVDSIPVELYVNGTLEDSNATDEDGLVTFLLSLDSSEIDFSLNITASVGESVSLYERQIVEQVVNFTRVSISDMETDGSDDFKFNYTLAICAGDSNETYVGVQNPIEAEVNLFNLSIWNAPVSFLVAKNITHVETTDGLALVPDDCDYLRVVEVYEDLWSYQLIKICFDCSMEDYVDYHGCIRIPAGTSNVTVIEEPVSGDVNGDESVDVLDAILVANAMDSHPGDPNWNPNADLNRDGVVDIFDAILLASNFGDTPILDAMLEFLEVVLDEEDTTNNLGLATENWNPSETGVYLVQVKLPSEFNATLALETEETQHNASLNLVDYCKVIKRPLVFSMNYTPAEPTFETNILLTVNISDPILDAPAANLLTEFHVYSLMDNEEIEMGQNYTDSSGSTTFSFVPEDYLTNPNEPRYASVIVRCPESQYTQEVEDYIVIECRYPTSLEFLNGEEIHVEVGVWYSLDAKLVRTDTGSPVNGVRIYFYINDEQTSHASTNSSGIAHWDWKPKENGTYYMKVAVDPANLYYKVSEDNLVAVAQIIPVLILFDVEPREFEPGDYITLNATVFNATSLEPLPDETVTFYRVDATGDEGPIGNNGTDGNGVAIWRTCYVSGANPPNAFMAKVGVNRTIMSSPVVLTVAKETVLTLNLEREENGFDHTISGNLLSNGDAVLGKQLKIYVNDTLSAVLATWEPYGNFSCILDLQTANNALTTYNIQAVFEGDEPCNSSAYGFLPNGTQYTICTTIQYGYKPTSNMTWLTVEPLSTQVTTTTKTAEQLRQEAKSSGILKVEHELTMWYPWYRTHFIFLNEEEIQFDLGISLLPFGNTAQFAESFMQKMVDLLPRVVWRIVITLATAEFSALLVSSGGPTFFLAALAMSVGLKLAAALGAWNSVDDLVSVFFATLISTVVGLVKSSIWDLFLNALYLLAQIRALAEVGFGKVYSIISVPLNIVYGGQILQRLDELGAL